MKDKPLDVMKKDMEKKPSFLKLIFKKNKTYSEMLFVSDKISTLAIVISAIALIGNILVALVKAGVI